MLPSPDKSPPLPEGQELTGSSFLDITAETCPMTFVRVRLALDRLPPGGVLEVLLKGEEPLRNVPRTVVEQGHAIIARESLDGGITRLLLRRKN